MATSIDQTHYVKTALRLPQELHAALHEAAQASGRSYNAEIKARLEASFEQPQSIKDSGGLVESIMSMSERIQMLEEAITGTKALPSEDALIGEMERAYRAITKDGTEPLPDSYRSRISAIILGTPEKREQDKLKVAARTSRGPTPSPNARKQKK